jgi:hypothetical protein
MRRPHAANSIGLPKDRRSSSSFSAVSGEWRPSSALRPPAPIDPEPTFKTLGCASGSVHFREDVTRPGKTGLGAQRTAGADVKPGHCGMQRQTVAVGGRLAGARDWPNRRHGGYLRRTPYASRFQVCQIPEAGAECSLSRRPCSKSQRAPPLTLNRSVCPDRQASKVPGECRRMCPELALVCLRPEKGVLSNRVGGNRDGKTTL